MAEGNQTSTIHLEVFTDHYATLIETLPVKSLAAKFVSAKIIQFSDQDEILKGETPQDKARRFLQHISNTLKSGNSEKFLTMLDVIEKRGGQYAYLAHNIRRDLSKCETSREKILLYAYNNIVLKVYECYIRLKLLSKYKYILNTLLLFHRCIVAGIFLRSSVTSRSVATSKTTLSRLVSRKE